MKIGMIFPGQGSQYLGMGKQFYDQERLVQEYFEQASSCLNRNFVRLCFASSEKELAQTDNAQTALFLVSAAIFSLLKQKHQVEPSLVAGHSLGEYSALFAAKGITFFDALYLLKKRAFLMQNLTNEYPGAMIAVLGLPYEHVALICERYDRPELFEHVAQVVNINTPTQVVVSGTVSELDAISEEVGRMGAKAFKLKVAGAFHSRLMNEVVEQFLPHLVKVDFSDLTVPVVTNVEAQKIRSAAQVKHALIRQTNSPVLWWQSMHHFLDCDLVVQIGPGFSYARMLQREVPGLTVVALNSPSDIEHLLDLISKVSKVALKKRSSSDQMV